MNTKKRASERLQWLAYIVAFGLLPFAANACSCWRPSPQQLLQSTPLIFMGTVTDVDRKANIANFSVSKVYKGLVTGKSIAIAFNGGPGSMCGISFREGDTHTVFAGYQRGNNGEEIFGTGLCSMAPYRSSPLRFQPAMDAYATDIAIAQQQTESNPGSAESWDLLSRIHEAEKDHLAALQSLEHLRLLSAEVTDVLVRIGNAQLALSRFEQALASFNLALEKNATSNTAKQGRNQALLKLGRATELDLGARNFTGMEMAAPNFNGKTLIDADFSQARMQRPLFERTVLTSSNFAGTDIYMGGFKGANLSGTHWEGAKTYQCNFESADLTSANLFGADLRGGNFSNANLSGAQFFGTKAESANFTNAVFRSAVFKDVYFFGADFSGVDLSGHDLSGGEMQGARFKDAKLVNANLTNAYFAGPSKPYRNNERLVGPGRAADFRGADLTGAKISGADFRFAMFDCKTRWPQGFQPETVPLFPVSSKQCPQLIKTMLFAKPGVLREMMGKIGGERSDIRGPSFENQLFPGIDLSGANLSGFTFSNVKFIGAALVGTDFRNADLQGSDFSGADLSHADLSGASLWGSKLGSAKLDGTKLKEAQYDAKTIWPMGFAPAKAGAKIH